MPVVFRQRVRALQQIPEHVLRAAPHGVRGGRYEGAPYVRELVRTECPAAALGRGGDAREPAHADADEAG